MVKADINTIELIGSNFYKVTFKPMSYNYVESFSIFLRKILYTSVYGCAITEVKIDNVNSEYDSLTGVKEDVMNILLNLKGIIFKLKNTRKIVVSLSCKGEKILRAEDIVISKNLKIINPKHIIAHTSFDANINMKIKIEKNKGYIFYNSKNYSKNRELDGILLDSYFSPILRVFYVIEKLECEFHNELEVIIFYIETNGSINARKALKEAIGFLLYQLSEFKIVRKEKIVKKKSNSFDGLNLNLFILLTDLEFTFRAWNCIKTLNIKYLGELVSYTEEELLKIRNLGKKTLKEIKKKTSYYDLHLGYKIDNWDVVLNDYLKTVRMEFLSINDET